MMFSRDCCPIWPILFVFKWIYFLLIVMSCHSSWANHQSLDHIVAVVNEDVILKSELQRKMQVLLQQFSRKNGQLLPESVLQRQVLDRMILESIQVQMAERIGIRVNDTEINTAIADIAERNQKNPEQFRQALSEQGIDYHTFRFQVSLELLLSRVQRRFVNPRIQVSDQDTLHFLASPLGREALSAEYRLGHILIAFSDASGEAEIEKREQLVKHLYKRLSSGEVSFQQAALTYSAGQTALKGGDLGWKRVAQLPTLFAEKAQQMTVGEISEPIRDGGGYHLITLIDKRGGAEKKVLQTKAQHILVKANAIRNDAQVQVLISELYERLLAGAFFDELAKAYSDDTATARRGGNLGWINPEMMVPEFEKVMNKQPEGAVSKPFRTQYGWHIIKVNQRRSQDFSEQNRIAMAKNLIFRRKFDEELEAWLREIKQNAYIEIRI